MHDARTRGFGAVLLAALVASCSNPETEKLEHLKRGDQYVDEKRDEFAVIEYASAVQLDPKFGEARLKLAQTYERMNNLHAAFPEYIRAADALPDDRAAQIKATELLLLGRRYEDAKARVAGLIEKDPKDVEAMLLHASAIAALKDPSGAIAEIEKALEIRPDDSRTLLTLGGVRVTEPASRKKPRQTFAGPSSLDPNSANPRLALANFLSAAGRVSESEATIKEAIAKEPQHLLANRMLADLYIATRRANEAEQPLKVIAEVSKAPAARLRLADYYLGVNRTKEATDILTALSSDPAAFADAESRLASIDYGAGRLPEAHTRLDGVLAKTPKNASVLAMKAQWLAAEDKLDEALERAKAAVAADPQSVDAYMALAVVQDRRREVADAIRSYTEVLRLNPRATASAGRAVAPEPRRRRSRSSPEGGAGRASIRPGEPRGADVSRQEPHRHRQPGAGRNRGRTTPQSVPQRGACERARWYASGRS